MLPTGNPQRTQDHSRASSPWHFQFFFCQLRHPSCQALVVCLRPILSPFISVQFNERGCCVASWGPAWGTGSRLLASSSREANQLSLATRCHELPLISQNLALCGSVPGLLSRPAAGRAVALIERHSLVL